MALSISVAAALRSRRLFCRRSVVYNCRYRHASRRNPLMARLIRALGKRGTQPRKTHAGTPVTLRTTVPLNASSAVSSATLGLTTKTHRPGRVRPRRPGPNARRWGPAASLGRERRPAQNHRRRGSRRAAGIRSGEDPGDSSGDSEPPGERHLARRPMTGVAL